MRYPLTIFRAETSLAPVYSTRRTECIDRMERFKVSRIKSTCIESDTI